MKNRQRKVFNGRILKVFQERKKLPNGRIACLEKVVHPGAALVVPFSGKRIVFIRQYRAVISRYIWELPAGTLNAGETPHSCAKREITEETGYTVGKIKKIGAIYPTPGYSSEKIHIFKAKCTGKTSPSTDSDELIKVRLLDINEVRKLFKSGGIVDSKTIAALAFAGIL